MSDKTQLYGSHPESPTAVLCSCAPKLAALDERIAKLEAIVHKEHTPTLNEHDDRLDSHDGQISRLNALFTIVGTVDENVRLLLKAQGITPIPRPTPRER